MKAIGNYIIQNQIGKGAFSIVYKGFDTRNKQTVATKVISIQFIVNKQQQLKQQLIQLLKQELKSIYLPKHQNLLNVIDITQSMNNFYIFSEYCNQGDLSKRIGKLSEQDAIEIFQQILTGYSMLYDANIMHRDLKPANIYIHDNTYKIGDYGFICENNNKEDQTQTDLVGSITYMAPEIMRRESYGYKADIYSLGIILYEMIEGKTPYADMKLYTNNVDCFYQKMIKIDMKYSKTSTETQQIINRMLALHSKDRISIQELKDIFSL